MQTAICPSCNESRLVERRIDDGRVCRECANRARQQPWTWERIEHGTNRGYNQHRHCGIDATPECGCLAARARHQGAQKVKRTVRKRLCGGCGQRKDVRADRGHLCVVCWRREERTHESEYELRGGRWVTIRGIQHWVQGAA